MIDIQSLPSQPPTPSATWPVACQPSTGVEDNLTCFLFVGLLFVFLDEATVNHLKLFSVPLS